MRITHGKDIYCHIIKNKEILEIPFQRNCKFIYKNGKIGQSTYNSRWVKKRSISDRTWSIQLSALMSDQMLQLYEAYWDDTLLDLFFTDGRKKYTGRAYISSININANISSMATLDIEFLGYSTYQSIEE